MKTVVLEIRSPAESMANFVQSFGCGESVRVLGSAKMAVVTFSNLVVVTHHADRPNNVTYPQIMSICI